MSIKDRSPERVKALKGIQKCRDFIDGQDAVKAKGDLYLIPFNPSMPADQFSLYLREAQIGGVTGAMWQSLTGAVTRRKPIVKIPAGSEWILTSFGERGQGLDLWMAETFGEQMKTSNNWIFIDYPAVEGNLSVAEAEAAKINPYPIPIMAEQVLDTVSEMRHAIEVLTEFRYETKEFEKNDSEYTYKEITRITKLFLGDDGFAYRQDYIDEEKDGAQTQFVANGNPLTRLPVWSLNGAIKPVVPLLKAMADVDEQLYNKKSRRNHINLLMGTSTIVTTGVPQADRDLLGGLGGIWHLGDSDAKAFTLSIDPNAVIASKEVIREDLNTAASLGARMFADNTREAESGEALAIKNASVHATLGQQSTVFSIVTEDILDFVIFWSTGVKPTEGEVSVELSKDFIPATLNGQDLTALVSARMQNLIPDSVFYNALKRGELIGDDLTLDAFLKELEEQNFDEPTGDPTPTP